MVEKDFVTRHLKYFQLNISNLPYHYTSSEASRMTLAFFCISSLDLLGLIAESPFEEQKPGWIEWIYSQQIVNNECGGFRGGPFLSCGIEPLNEYDQPHLAMTYTALLCLLILGDDLSRVRKSEIIKTLAHCQSESGSFSASIGSSERDMRFLFCAFAISYILADWSGVNLSSALQFIHSSKNFDGAFGVGPGLESHGGSTYCVVTSLALAGKLDLLEKEKLIYWLISRQDKGFHGRINKPDDTCYGFWIGSCLDILETSHLVDCDALLSFMDTTISKYGGYGKTPGSHPDVMHAYMGIAALSIAKKFDIPNFCPTLGVSLKTVNFAKVLGFAVSSTENDKK